MVIGALAALNGVKLNSVTAESVDYDGVHLDKTARLEADGTYTIKLEAYVTSQTVTVQTEQIVPTDFVTMRPIPRTHTTCSAPDRV